MLAGSTGLEPAASGVTGRRSNQLNYDPEENYEIADFIMQTSNWGVSPIVLQSTRSISNSIDQQLNLQSEFSRMLVGGTGLEPVTAGV